MIDLEATARFIAEFEGFVDHVYLDAAGVETIGYGETRPDILDRYRGSGISQEEALELLKSRVQSFADDVEAHITNRDALTPNRHAALTSLAYNIGVGAFAESTACRRFNEGDLAGVPEAMSWWDKAGGTVLAGLARRRAAEAELFLRDEGAAPPSGGTAPSAPATGAGAGAPPWRGRYLRSGDRGDDVRTVQQCLCDRGWGIGVDGAFGPGTDKVVRAFQQEKGLNADGVVGPDTWRALWTSP